MCILVDVENAMMAQSCVHQKQSRPMRAFCNGCDNTNFGFVEKMETLPTVDNFRNLIHSAPDLRTTDKLRLSEDVRSGRTRGRGFTGTARETIVCPLDDTLSSETEKQARMGDVIQSQVIYEDDLLPVVPPRPDDHLPLACIVMLCCNPVAGVIALVFSLKSSSTYDDGDYFSARRYSSAALIASSVGIFVSSVVAVAVLVTCWPT